MSLQDPGSVVREAAHEELIRAEAEVVRASATAVKGLLYCVVVLTGATLIAVATGNFVLGTACLAAIGALAAAMGRAKGPPR